MAPFLHDTAYWDLMSELEDDLYEYDRYQIEQYFLDWEADLEEQALAESWEQYVWEWGGKVIPNFPPAEQITFQLCIGGSQ